MTYFPFVSVKDSTKVFANNGQTMPNFFYSPVYKKFFLITSQAIVMRGYTTQSSTGARPQPLPKPDNLRSTISPSAYQRNNWAEPTSRNNSRMQYRRTTPPLALATRELSATMQVTNLRYIT